MHWIWSAAFYGSGLLLTIGAFGLVRPTRRLGVPTRRRAAIVSLVGAAAAAITIVTATRTRRIPERVSALDSVMPAFHVGETHAIDIDAPADRVYRAVRDVTPDEMSGYRTLVWLRCLGPCAGESILNPAGSQPILATALRTSFLLLHDTTDVEIVFGTFVAAPPDARARTWTSEAFTSLQMPGYAKAVMNFRLAPRAGHGVRLTTETRILSTDAATARAFAIYWRLIAPGSDLIRRAWLGAIKRRAEREVGRGGAGASAAAGLARRLGRSVGRRL